MVQLGQRITKQNWPQSTPQYAMSCEVRGGIEDKTKKVVLCSP